jgi:hypothetical protein
MVLNATIINTSVISWRLVSLVEETGENHRPAASIFNLLVKCQLSHIPGEQRYYKKKSPSNRVVPTVWYFLFFIFFPFIH